MAPIPKSMQPPGGFVFDTPEGRPFRITSVETEVDGNGTKLAQTLYKEGMVDGPNVRSYGYHPGTNHSCIAFLKHDGTVTGGELVFDRIDLTDQTHAAAMYRTHELLRGLEKSGVIAYNPNCGGHIHMDAGGFGFYDVLRLIVLFGYIEEPIFRLAGAGKTYGHRTLYKGRPHNGEGYSHPVVKGPFGEVTEAFRKVLGQRRHSGLNTQIYSANACHGACKGEMYAGTNRYGEPTQVKDMKQCKCRKEKFTIEWRVWNAQGNPKILYSWIALMQALHAYSWRPVGTQYKKWEVMEPLSWEVKPFSKLTKVQHNLIQGRLEWIFGELPLTADEKEALRYAYMRTPYKAFGKDWFKRLSNQPYKKPPFGNQYTPVIQRKINNEPNEGPTEAVGNNAARPQFIRLEAAVDPYALDPELPPDNMDIGYLEDTLRAAQVAADRGRR